MFRRKINELVENIAILALMKLGKNQPSIVVPVLPSDLGAGPEFGVWVLFSIFKDPFFFAANVCCIVPKPHAVRVSAAVARCEAKNDAAAREGGSGIRMDGAGNCDTQGV